MYPFCSIGKLNLVPAMGLSRNLSSEIDRKASGCLSCPHYAALIRGEVTADICDLCKQRKTAYQNEKSRYGYKESLTKSELFVFLALHLHGPSSTGLIDDISARTIAEECLIAVKTAYAALHGLALKNYIFLRNDSRGSYTVLIRDYEKYFSPAKEGGRGYVVITQDIFRQLLTIKGNINAVRYALRSYVNIEMDSKNSPTHELVHSESIRQALSYLPGYFRPCHLKKIVTDFLPDMLSLVKGIGKSICLRLDPAYYGQTVKQNILDEQADDFQECLDEVLSDLHKKDEGLLSVSEMSDLSAEAHFSLVHMRADTNNIHLKPEDLVKTDRNSLLSLAQISLEYGKERVLEALRQVWHEWRPGTSDQAAYIRTLLRGESVPA